MTTGPMAQSREAGPGTPTPQPDTAEEPERPRSRGPAIAVIALLLLALGVQGIILRSRARSGRSSENPPEKQKRARPAQAPRSVIRIAAAPRSVVHVVSAPSLGRSHVEMPADASA